MKERRRRAGAALAPLIAGLMDLQNRMAAMEGQFAAKVDKELDVLKSVNDQKQAHGIKLQEIQESMEACRKERETKQDATIQEVFRRIDLREARQVWRPHRFERENADGPRVPALMLGGWGEMTEASEVVHKAKFFAEKMALECVGCGHDRYVCFASEMKKTG